MIYTDFADIPRQKYAAIAADVPWHHKSYSTKGQARSPSRYYSIMSLDDICALPVADIAAKNAHLFFWTTQPHLEQAFVVLRAWGFKYSSCFRFWVKLNPRAADQMFLREADFHRGMGFTTRKNVEPCLLGRRGSPKRLRKDLGDILIAARRQHSRKPDQFYADVESYCAGPRIDLFSRQERDGWDCFGNEADKFERVGPGKVDPRSRYASQDEQFGPPHPWPTTPLLDPPSELLIPSYLKRLAAT